MRKTALLPKNIFVLFAILKLLSGIKKFKFKIIKKMLHKFNIKILCKLLFRLFRNPKCPILA